MEAALTNVASIVLAMTVAFMAILAFWRPAPFTRLRMVYKLEASAPLIHEAVSPDPKLMINYETESVREPHIMHISLSNTGKRDIPSYAFDQQMPLRIDLGAKIVAILNSTPQPDTAPELKACKCGTELAIGPSLIPSHVRLDFLLLVDGRGNGLTHKSPLENVELRQVIPGQRTEHNFKATAAGYAVVAVVVWWIAKEPTSAAHLVSSIGNFLSGLAAGFSRFVSSI
jgi:hypothetical protein